MNPDCPRCGAGCSVRHGQFYRHDDAQTIQRYRCNECGKCHSSATHTPTYRQKRRRLNRLIEQDIVSGSPQRGIARKHGCTRKTVARKIRFLAQLAREKIKRWLSRQSPFDHVQWDELITFEQSRLKPLSVAVTVAVAPGVSGVHRSIVGFGVASIPASGLIAKRSIDKYGQRRDRSSAMRKAVLKTVARHLSPTVLIESDEHARYGEELKRALPHSSHAQYPSVRGSLTGQGELKRTGVDPLFVIDHTLAMLRDTIKRLTRKSGCTTKQQRALEAILTIYSYHHNTKLITNPSKRQS